MPFTRRRSLRPWFACTSTPTVAPPALSTTREAVPIPPLKPWQIIPVPPPTFPSGTGPLAVEASADSTCSGRTCMPLMSFRSPSQVSPTTGRLQNSRSSVREAISAEMSASRTIPTEWVFVSAIGEHSIPDSRIHSSPVSSPFPFRRCAPANTGSYQGLSSWGWITVTPVRMSSPSMSVVCPTLTPVTSVIAFSSPVGSVPTAIPRSRARDRATREGYATVGLTVSTARRRDVALEPRGAFGLGHLDGPAADDDAVSELGCGGRMLRSRDPEASQQGNVGGGPRSLDETGQLARRRFAGACRSRERDEVEPAVRALGRGPDALGWRRGRYELHPGKVGRGLERKVGDDEAGRPRGGGVVSEALVPPRLEDGGVRHRDERNVDLRPRLGQAIEARLGAHPLRPCALAGEPDHRPVGERVREREAELEEGGAPGHRGGGELRRLLPGHQVDGQALHRDSTVARSLSPRPERPTRITSASSSSARASACAGSSAGMIPSRSARRWNAASASSSVAGRYSARPESLRNACSGPTPG